METNLAVLCSVPGLIVIICVQGGGRVDGRQPGQLRPISCQAGPLARCVHGSGLFSRGETQSLATATVGHDRDIGQVREVLLS
jgi:polyribonucleotide nucleotidyltransferase